MELKDFVSKVLVDLNEAVDEARELTSRDMKFTTGKDNRTVEFDIAVTVEDENSASGKAGIQVLRLVEAGGTVSETSKNATVSRVSFGVHIEYLTKEETRQLG